MSKTLFWMGFATIANSIGIIGLVIFVLGKHC
jgi:hypothetical protein